MKAINQMYKNICLDNISYISITQEDILDLVVRINKLSLRIAKDNYQDEGVYEMLSLFKGYMNEITSCLIPYSEVIVHKEEINRVVGSVIKRYPQYKDESIAIISTMRKLLKVEKNKLLKQVIELISSNLNKNIAIVSKYNLTNGSKEKLIKRFPTKIVNMSLNFFNDNTYRRINQVYDLTIFLKSESIFGSYANNCIKATETIFLSYDAFYNQYTYRGILRGLGEYSTIKEKDKKVAHLKEEKKIEDSISESIINEEKINSFFNRQYNGEERREYRSTEAKLFILEGNRGILLEIDKEYECFIGGEDTEVEKKGTNEIQVDEYIVINNKSEPELCSEIANILFLDNMGRVYEGWIDRWKQRLIDFIDKDGIEKTCSRLQENGMETAKIANVRNWTTEYFVLPNDRIILDILGFSISEKENIINAADKIRSARIKAGRHISNKIKEKIKQLNMEQLIEEDCQSFEIEELRGASFNIERIVAIGKINHVVPSNRVGQIFKLRDIKGE